MARRDNREYRTYLRAEQRRQRGCIARRMQRHLHHGLLERTARRRATPANPANSRMTVAGSGTGAAAGANRKSSKANASARALKVMSARTNGILLRSPRKPLSKINRNPGWRGQRARRPSHRPVKQCDGWGIRC